MGQSTRGRLRIETDNPWERTFGYARAIRVGGFVAVSGLVASRPDGSAIGDTPYEQTAAILGKLKDVLGKTGAGLSDVVRLRVLYTDTGIAEGFLRALSEAFPDGAPTLTAVRVAGLVSPEFQLEIEADAIVDAGRTRERDEIPDWDEEAD